MVEVEEALHNCKQLNWIETAETMRASAILEDKCLKRVSNTMKSK